MGLNQSKTLPRNSKVAPRQNLSIANVTNFSDSEVRMWQKEFLTKNPSGSITKEHFRQIYYDFNFFYPMDDFESASCSIDTDSNEKLEEQRRANLDKLFDNIIWSIFTEKSADQDSVDFEGLLKGIALVHNQFENSLDKFDQRLKLAYRVFTAENGTKFVTDDQFERLVEGFLVDLQNVSDLGVRRVSKILDEDKIQQLAIQTRQNSISSEDSDKSCVNTPQMVENVEVKNLYEAMKNKTYEIKKLYEIFCKGDTNGITRENLLNVAHASEHPFFVYARKGEGLKWVEDDPPSNIEIPIASSSPRVKKLASTKGMPIPLVSSVNEIKVKEPTKNKKEQLNKEESMYYI